MQAMEQLTPKEQKLVETFYPLLENVARKHRKKLTVEEAVSIAFEGAVKALRTYDSERGNLDRWVESCVTNSLRDQRKKEARRNAKNLQLSFEPVDHREPTQDPRYEAICDLPDYLCETVLTWLKCEGDVKRTARWMGVSVAEAKDNLAIAQEKLQNL